MYEQELMEWGLDPQRLSALNDLNRDEVLRSTHGVCLDLIDHLDQVGVDFMALPDNTKAHLIEALFSAALIQDNKLVEHMDSAESHVCDKLCPMNRLTKSHYDEYEEFGDIYAPGKLSAVEPKKPMDFGGEW